MRFPFAPVMLALFATAGWAQQPVAHAAHSSAPSAHPSLRVTVDSVHSRIVLTAGPFRIEPMHGEMHMQDEGLAFHFPVDGWLHGYQVDLVDGANSALPREDIHHVGLVNFGRRELLYPELERMMAAGSETDGIDLPATLGVPIASGDSLRLFAGLHSPSGRTVESAYVRVTLLWLPKRGHRPLPVLPFYADVNNHVGGTTAFDLPPGRSTRASEFTMPLSGDLIAIGGHMHQYGVSLTLMDAESGRTLARIKSDRAVNGKIRKMGRFVFGFNQDALRLEAGHHYRVVAEYDNTSGAAIPMGGMGSIAGPFAPDDYSKWPRLDLNNPDTRKDIASLGNGMGMGMRMQ